MDHNQPPRPWQRPYDDAATEDDIFYCFRLLLGRSPSPDEWSGHSAQAGGALDRIVASYLSSMEFDQRHLLRRSDAPPPLHQLPDFRLYTSPDDPGLGDLFGRGVYEPPVERLIRALLRPGMGFLDIGANIGYFSLIASGVVGPAGHVYAVEANADNARLLEASRRENGFDNITVLQVAAGARSGLLALHTQHSTGTASALPDSADWLLASRTVPSLRLDDLVADTPRLGLIKIDIDGGEFPALQGAARLIATHRPALITEFCPGMLTDISGIDAYGYLDWLRAQGYALAVITESGAAEGDADNESILAALSRQGTDHLDLLARPLGAPTVMPADRHDDSPAARDGRALRETAAAAAERIAAANRHAFHAEQRARTAEAEQHRLAAALHRDAARLAALEAEVPRLTAALAQTRARADAAQALVAAMRASTSWRLTAPLRWLRRRSES
jgi:FkbM family methyltransferase